MSNSSALILPNLKNHANRVQKRIAISYSPIAILRMIKSLDYFKPLTYLVSFDLLFEALFLWITFFLAKRSSIEITFAKSGVASALVAVPLNFLMAFLVVLAWYLLRRRFAAFALILFIDDLWFAILANYSFLFKDCKYMTNIYIIKCLFKNL